jgi:hypothetical protein
MPLLQYPATARFVKNGLCPRAAVRALGSETALQPTSDPVHVLEGGFLRPSSWHRPALSFCWFCCCKHPANPCVCTSLNH